MENIVFMGEKDYQDESNRRLNLRYYLLETRRAAVQSEAVYGIGIEKTLKGEGKHLFEKEMASCISYSKVFVKQMIQKLMDNLVTPVSMLEILDDMITEEEMNEVTKVQDCLPGRRR